MAKFCEKCNSPMNEEDVKCGYCGAPASSSKPAKKQQLDVAKLMKNPNVKKFAPIVAVLVVVLLVVAIIVPNVGYKATFNNYMKGYIKNNPDKVVKASSSVLLPDDEEDLNDYKEDLEDRMNDKYEDLQDEYGDNVKIKYEILGAYDLSEASAEYLEELLEEAEVDFGKEVKGKIVVYTVTVKGEKEEYTTHDSLLLIKEEGKWKVCDF